jgi:hypothetical protein
LTDILQIAASDDPTTRTKALTFFLDNFYATYHRHYDSEHFRDLAFIPAVLGSGKVLAKPLEVGILSPSLLFFI